VETYILGLAGFGVLILLTAWLPMILKEAPLSLPIACVITGAGIYGLLPVPGPPPDLIGNRSVTERLTELVVIISLMGAGLKIDRPFALRSWKITWRLLGPGMLTIVLLAISAHLLLGLGAAAAILLAACLAPTDPVLASDVQVGRPHSGEEDEVRFALTSEAGLNDGLAFPFVLLAVMLAGGEGWWGWFTYALVWKIAAGTTAGYLLGRGLAWPGRCSTCRTGPSCPALGRVSSHWASRCWCTGRRSSLGATVSSLCSSPPSHSALRSPSTSTARSCTTLPRNWNVCR
jgi:NhaP-type Na+/H+ or K+/H+ antiporter